MSWTYEIKPGRLRDKTGQQVEIGYSGFGDGKNNPAMQNHPDMGPIPVGTYTIGVPHDTESHGPYVMSLTPAPANQMFGRSGFLMHGDSRVHPGSASHGCIIMPRPTREMVWNSNDHQLQVVEGESDVTRTTSPA